MCTGTGTAQDTRGLPVPFPIPGKPMNKHCKEIPTTVNHGMISHHLDNKKESIHINKGVHKYLNYMTRSFKATKCQLISI